MQELVGSMILYPPKPKGLVQVHSVYTRKFRGDTSCSRCVSVKPFVASNPIERE